MLGVPVSTSYSSDDCVEDPVDSSAQRPGSSECGRRGSGSAAGLGLLHVLRIDPREALFETRGFRAQSAEKQSRLEAAAGAFVSGYNRALFPYELSGALAPSEGPAALAGFRVEGAAMAVAITDAFPFRLIRGRRLGDFLAITADRHPYLATVGAGWAMAKTPWRARAILSALDPVLMALAFDGLGFHDCFFDPRKFATGAPRRLERLAGGLAGRSWDRGAGRALWFASGGDARRAWRGVQSAAVARQADMSAGLGLAMTYAGGLTAREAASLSADAGPLDVWLAQGAAFALEAHVRASTDTAQTHETFTALSGLSVEQGLRIVRQTKPSAPGPMAPPLACTLHETWREALAMALSTKRRQTR
ncbi:DUF1702 family protein [Primorskyibacter sp. 2E107]|uniref:DUF1702 family protein n=1 Tax=Primorskyibacter sp. 2E107 TaxID=3403458 RepID=UPI003AF649D7